MDIPLPEESSPSSLTTEDTETSDKLEDIISENQAVDECGNKTSEVFCHSDISDSCVDNVPGDSVECENVEFGSSPVQDEPTCLSDTMPDSTDHSPFLNVDRNLSPSLTDEEETKSPSANEEPINKDFTPDISISFLPVNNNIEAIISDDVCSVSETPCLPEDSSLVIENDSHLNSVAGEFPLLHSSNGEGVLQDISETPLPSEPPPCHFTSTLHNDYFPAIDSIEDIPVPDDMNRYSPSLPIEDDPPALKADISSIALPLGPPLPLVPTVSVLGKEAAKKRLLAFSMSKQSLQAQKKPKSGNTDKEASNDYKNLLMKKKKKGVLSKARDTISEIEEIKRREIEVRENMLNLYPMWASSDPKATSMPSVYLPDDVERSDRLDNAIEKIQKREKEKERQEREEREEERRKKREKKERERRLSPKNWAEFTKVGLKAYHYRRVKTKREKISESKNKSRSRDKSERGSSKKFNLLDTPMEIKSSFVVVNRNNEEIKFPSWSVKLTACRPNIPYSYNPKVDTSHFITRQEMMDSLPDDILQIVKNFFEKTFINSGVTLPVSERLLLLMSEEMNLNDAVSYLDSLLKLNIG